MNRIRALAVAGSMSVSLLFANEPARGDGDQDGKEARARSLFEEGRVEMRAGHYSEACPKFADSKTLDPGAGTMLNLAYCYEKLGRAAAAWAEYRAAALAAHEHGRVDWENAARERAERLETRLVWVVVHAETQPDGALLAVRLDGDPMSTAALERPLPVEPGHHEPSLKVYGSQPADLKFELGEHHAPLVLGLPSPIGTELYDGLIPRRLFADLVSRGAQSSHEFPMKPFTFRQGLLEVSVPVGFDPASSLVRIDYSIVPAGHHKSIPFGGFGLPLGDYSVVVKAPNGKDAADGKK